MLDLKNLEKDLTDLLLDKYGVSKDKLNSDGIIPKNSSLHHDLGLSLLSQLRLTDDIKHDYGVTIMYEDATSLKTFGDVISYIREHCKV